MRTRYDPRRFSFLDYFFNSLIGNIIRIHNVTQRAAQQGTQADLAFGLVLMLTFSSMADSVY
jgi:hypothetical protein